MELKMPSLVERGQVRILYVVCVEMFSPTDFWHLGSGVRLAKSLSIRYFIDINSLQNSIVDIDIFNNAIINCDIDINIFRNAHFNINIFQIAFINFNIFTILLSNLIWYQYFQKKHYFVSINILKRSVNLFQKVTQCW